MSHWVVNVAGCKRRRRRLCIGLSVVWVSVAFVGCLSLERMAPPVDEGLIAVGGQQGFDSQVLVRGRDVYLNQCIACHSVEPIDRYSIEQWRETLPDMAQEAKLDRLQTDDLLAYLMTSHHFLRTASTD